MHNAAFFSQILADESCCLQDSKLQKFINLKNISRQVLHTACEAKILKQNFPKDSSKYLYFIISGFKVFHINVRKYFFKGKSGIHMVDHIDKL